MKHDTHSETQKKVQNMTKSHTEFTKINILLKLNKGNFLYKVSLDFD